MYRCIIWKVNHVIIAAWALEKFLEHQLDQLVEKLAKFPSQSGNNVQATAAATTTTLPLPHPMFQREYIPEEVGMMDPQQDYE